MSTPSAIPTTDTAGASSAAGATAAVVVQPQQRQQPRTLRLLPRLHHLQPVQARADSLFQDALHLIFTFLSADEWHHSAVWRVSRHYHASALSMKPRGDRIANSSAGRLRAVASSSLGRRHVTRVHILCRPQDVTNDTRSEYFDDIFRALLDSSSPAAAASGGTMARPSVWLVTSLEFECTLLQAEWTTLQCNRQSLPARSVAAFDRLREITALTHLTFISIGEFDQLAVRCKYHLSPLWYLLLKRASNAEAGLSHLSSLTQLDFLHRSDSSAYPPVIPPAEGRTLLLAHDLTLQQISLLLHPGHRLHSLRSLRVPPPPSQVSRDLKEQLEALLATGVHPTSHPQMVLARQCAASLTRLDLVQVDPNVLDEFGSAELWPHLRHLRIELDQLPIERMRHTILPPAMAGHLARLESLHLVRQVWCAASDGIETFAAVMRALESCTSLTLEGGFEPGAEFRSLRTEWKETIARASVTLLEQLDQAPALTALTLLHMHRFTHADIIAGLNACSRLRLLRIGLAPELPPDMIFIRTDAKWSREQVEACQPLDLSRGEIRTAPSLLPQLTHFEYRDDLHLKESSWERAPGDGRSRG